MLNIFFRKVSKFKKDIKYIKKRIYILSNFLKMEAKAILSTRVKLNELAANHNKLTTLVAVMFSEIQHMKEDMDNIKNLLENVEVVSEETSKPVQQPVRQQPVVQQSARQTITPPPVPTTTTNTTSGRTSSRNRRNQTFSEIQADDIIKQLTMNSD